ncbi:bacteriohemerythrin [Carboxylicivirga marina]|uniref:histidine kinase n=1 Tax=Carboxylicivirga marina TaxID=2800988 RepID=A0ABS1HQ51_9BACT|nr:bacteriohemerythrin [Carboxylicivirga marina]MBK3519781.1 bacteriohemerythrin [Carboxylicivirga marina]
MKELDNFDIFPWNKNFETDIEIIDKQHMKLISIVNRLAIHVVQHSSISILDSIFDELIQYTDYHFKTEEEYWHANMKECHWSDEHSKTHKNFINEIINLKNEKGDLSEPQVTQELLSFLTNWLAYHILDSDKRMAIAVGHMNSGYSFEEAKGLANDAMSGSMKTLIETILKMYDNLSVRTIDLLREKSRRKKAEQELLSSEKRWQFLLEETDEAIWEWDIKNKIGSSIYNSPFYSFLVKNEQTSKEEIIKIHPDDIEHVKSELVKHLDGKTNFFSTEYRVLRKNKSWSRICSKGKVVERNKQNVAIRMLGTHADITERELGSLIYYQSHQSIVIADSNCEITNVNPAFFETTGYTNKDMVGQELLSWIDKTKNEQLINQLQDILKYDGQWSGELIGSKKTGEKFTAWAKIFPIGVKDKTVESFVIIFTDISDRKEVETQLLNAKNKAVESDILKTEFINNMSHEIRTPMNGIIGFTNLLKAENTSEKDRSSYIDIVQSCGTQLLGIIDNILEISKLETKQVKLVVTEVNLNELILNLFSSYNARAVDNGIQLYIKKEAKVQECKILADENKLYTILNHLLDNAFKFTSQGSIELGYSTDLSGTSPKISIYIKDTGIGIQEEYQHLIFERFSQEKKNLTDKVGGLGLGLSIARENARLMNGDIEMISAPGKGATFIVTLPYNTPVNKVYVPEKKINNTEFVVLIAEDEEINSILLETYLNKMDFACLVITVRDGKEAIEVCQNRHVDIILMDLKMLNVDGFEATERIKELYPRMPIIAQTAYTEEEDERRALNAGCDDFITKPIIQKKLEELMLKHLTIDK